MWLVARRAAALAGIVAGLLAAACPTAGASTPKGFTYSGDCKELQLGARADSAALSARVPGDFVPIGSPLSPIVTVGVAACDSTTADGRRVAPFKLSLVGTPLVPRAAGFERYWLWHVSNRGKVNAGFKRMGVASATVRGINLKVGTSSAGLIPARGDVRWAHRAYSIDADVIDSPPGPLQGTSVFWHRGRHGLVKVTYEITNGSTRTAQGRIKAQPGSPLAALVGTDATAMGLLIDFHFEASAEFVD